MTRTAMITGGSRGIGFAIAERLSRDGYRVAIMARGREEDCQERLSLLKGPYLYCQGNILSREDREKFLRLTLEKFGAVHVLVNNAGVAPGKRTDLLEMTEESFDRVVGINTKGNLFMTQAVAKQMMTQEFCGKKRGDIINISSCSAEVSSTGRGEYCVSKAGVSMLTSLFADRLASSGILVNEVRPGVISTDMTSTVKGKYDKLIADGIFPLARWGTPEDVAGAVAALVSDDFLYTTGSHIDVDGGFHIRRL